MFVLDKNVAYLWPVTFNQPKDGGGHDKCTFEVKFKRVSQARIKAYHTGEEATDVNWCKEVVVDWKGVKAPDGSDVPFSETNLDALLDIPNMASAIVLAYFESIHGGTKRKN